MRSPRAPTLPRTTAPLSYGGGRGGIRCGTPCSVRGIYRPRTRPRRGMQPRLSKEPRRPADWTRSAPGFTTGQGVLDSRVARTTHSPCPPPVPSIRAIRPFNPVPHGEDPKPVSSAYTLVQAARPWAPRREPASRVLPCSAKSAATVSDCRRFLCVPHTSAAPPAVRSATPANIDLGTNGRAVRVCGIADPIHQNVWTAAVPHRRRP
jgi:hypothetical protein